jgi:hypothetical protein
MLGCNLHMCNAFQKQPTIRVTSCISHVCTYSKWAVMSGVYTRIQHCAVTSSI